MKEVKIIQRINEEYISKLKYLLGYEIFSIFSYGNRSFIQTNLAENLHFQQFENLVFIFIKDDQFMSVQMKSVPFRDSHIGFDAWGISIFDIKNWNDYMKCHNYFKEESSKYTCSYLLNGIRGKIKHMDLYSFKSEIIRDLEDNTEEFGVIKLNAFIDMALSFQINDQLIVIYGSDSNSTHITVFNMDLPPQSIFTKENQWDEKYLNFKTPIF